MNISRSIGFLFLQFFAIHACIASPVGGAPAEYLAQGNALLVANAGVLRPDGQFLRPGGPLLLDNDGVPRTVTVPAVPVPVSASVLPRSSATAPSDAPRDKWLMALSAFGLIGWQLRRKHMSLRAGQLYVTGRPNGFAVSAVNADERRRAPSNVVPIKDHAANDGIARAAR